MQVKGLSPGHLIRSYLMGYKGKIHQHHLGCEGLRGQATGPGSPDGWRAEMRGQRPAFSPGAFPNTPPVPRDGDGSLGRARSRKSYRTGINVTNSYLKYLLWARHWGIEMEQDLLLASRGLSVQWERQTSPWVMSTCGIQSHAGNDAGVTPNQYREHR